MIELHRICVFAGSRSGARPEYAAAARALGHTLAARGIGLVYGASGVGLMGAVAEAALAGGGEVIGIIPHALARRELPRNLSELRYVTTLHERKALMAEYSDAFIALPGGLGTLDELSEMLTWTQLGIHAKPVGLLECAGFYRPLLAFVEQMAAQGFLYAEERDFLLVDDDPDRLLDALAEYRPTTRPPVWMTPDEV